MGPEGAHYDGTLKLFLLPYDIVRSAAEPERVLHEFFQSTYEATANLGRWDCARFERPFLAHPPRQPEPRTEVLPELLGAL
ncbi:MAG: DUF5996 family protein [Myxococcaceae bacterium]